MDGPWLVYVFWDSITVLYLVRALCLHHAYGAHRTAGGGTAEDWRVLRVDLLTALYTLLSFTRHIFPWESNAPRILLLAILVLTLLFDLLGPVFRGNDAPRSTAQSGLHSRPPAGPIDEAWARYWTEQLDEASQEHLQQVLHKSE